MGFEPICILWSHDGNGFRFGGDMEVMVSGGGLWLPWVWPFPFIPLWVLWYGCATVGSDMVVVMAMGLDQLWWGTVYSGESGDRGGCRWIWFWFYCWCGCNTPILFLLLSPYLVILI